MNKTFRHWIFLGVAVIGILTIPMLTACKPETGRSPVATPALGQASAFTNLRPTPLPLTPWSTPTLLPDHGVRMDVPKVVALASKMQGGWIYRDFDNHTLLSVHEDNGSKLLMAIDVNTGQTQVLAKEDTKEIGDAHISGQYLVWVTQQDTNYKLYVRDLKTSQTLLIGEGVYYDVHLSGNVVVWRQIGQSWDIWGYDLSQNKAFPVVTRADIQTPLLISGRWVIYKDESDKDDIGVGLYAINLDTHNEIRLGSVYSSSSQYVPPLYAIDAPWVAWSTGQWSTQPELHLYNLDTTTSYTITVASCSFREQAGRPQHLLISGGLLLFNGCYQDLGYDIEKKEFFSLPTYTPEMQGSSWAGWSLFGDQLIWMQTSGPYGQEESHIYTARIIRDK